MKKKIVAIGGGENGRLLEDGTFAPYNTQKIDEEIVKLSNKEKPNFLFINHAMPSLQIQESYFQTMKKIYENKFNCVCKDLKTTELKDKLKVKEKIEWADIIYEGGGDTLYMIDLWKKTGFDKFLYNAWNKGKVICGISAGAVCWFKSCNSECSNQEQNSSFKSVDCLNWINLHLTPHCNESGRYESTKLQLKTNNLIGIMLSNCAALEILNDKYRLILSDEKAYGIKAYWNKDKYIEEKILTLDEFKNINEILNKKEIINYTNYNPNEE